MIDPRRKEQNEARARALVALQRRLRVNADDPQAIALERSMNQAIAKNHPVPEPFQGASLPDLLPPADALTMAAIQVKHSIEPLRHAITDLVATKGPVTVRFFDNDYELTAPDSYEADPFTLAAPLTRHSCPGLVTTTAQMLYLVFDPGDHKPLAVEQARYARERASIIQFESWLWQQAEEYGGPTNLIPYATRVLMLLTFWHPSAHEPPGAWTVCVRCGVLLHRKKRSFTTTPRCAACMKETPSQRRWPAHAMAPHGRGTWLLRCQYPECDIVFEGPRHRKLCPDHTSSRLPPSRRLAAGRDQ